MSDIKKFAFLGVGNMASAIINGMKTDMICLYDRDKQKYNAFFNKPYLKAQSASEAVAYADYVILAVKPQNFEELLNEIKTDRVKLDNKVFISIAAGISTDHICHLLGQEVSVIRTMPNTPLLICRGVTALCRNQRVTEDEYRVIEAMFSTNGITFELPEDKMNAVIAATSSAPAYVYLFIKAIKDTATASGIDNPDLLNIIAEMVIGAAEMIKCSSLTPAELIKAVSSPNGTTERALSVLNDHHFAKIISEAMNACTARAEEIAANISYKS